MSHKNIEIKEGAYIISDAHYSSSRPELYNLIKSIYLKKNQPTQLFLFGDIFDTLFYGVPKTIADNKEMIDMINSISTYIDLIYLEGNHDFNLKNIFPNANVYKIEEQPVECTFKDKKVFIAHGDFGEDWGYRIYTKFIRNHLILRTLNSLNNICGNFILNKLDVYLDKKDDCNTFKGFEKYIETRLKDKYKCDYFIEGHFHQNKIINYNNYTYINLAAFACNQRYFTVESSQDNSFLQEKIFKKER